MAGFGRDVILGTPELGPNQQGGRVLKGTVWLLQKLSFLTLFLFSLLHSLVFKENPLYGKMLLKSSTWKQPRRGEQRLFSTTSPAEPSRWPLFTCRVSNQETLHQQMHGYKENWATGLPVPSSVLFPLPNLAPQPPLQGPRFCDSS